MTARTLLRADYVKLSYAWAGVPIGRLLEAENGWLTLTDEGQVLFFEGGRLDPAATPKFAAPSPRNLSCTRALDLDWGALRVAFGPAARFVYFTGFHRPPGSTSDAEASAGMAASMVGQTVIGTLGQAAGLLTEAKTLFIDNRGSGARGRAAKAAWVRVLTGAIPWQQIVRNT